MSNNSDPTKFAPSPRPPLHRTRSTENEEQEPDLPQSKLSKTDSYLESDATVEETDEDNSLFDDGATNEDESEKEEEPERFFPYISEKSRSTTPEPELKEKVKSQGQQFSYLLIGLIPVSVVILACVYQIGATSKPTLDINSIKERFPTQDPLLWTYFESGIADVVKFNKPSTFIFLYKDDAEKVLENLLSKLSKYAACKITDCQKEAIELTDQELNSPTVVKDYGILIEKYRDKLTTNGVMIIKNLEKVRGTSAQVFHSFCDEFSPLVDKSVFIFTMKVQEFPSSGSVMRFVEDFLRSKWTDIKSDIFNALVTRITNIVLVIRA